jgi:hypothetical protein
LGRAAREKVPIPDNEDDEAWHEAIGGGYFLSTAAYANLRAAIRKERNEKWEFRLKVMGFLASSGIGLIGALIGLVSALKNNQLKITKFQTETLPAGVRLAARPARG